MASPPEPTDPRGEVHLATLSRIDTLNLGIAKLTDAVEGPGGLRQYGYRNRHLIYAVFGLGVVVAGLVVFAIINSITAHHAVTRATQSQETQYQSCVSSNAVRVATGQVNQNILVVLQQGYALIQQERPRLSPSLTPLYNKELALYRQAIATARKDQLAFGPRDCAKLFPH